MKLMSLDQIRSKVNLNEGFYNIKELQITQKEVCISMLKQVKSRLENRDKEYCSPYVCDLVMDASFKAEECKRAIRKWIRQMIGYEFSFTLFVYNDHNDELNRSNHIIEARIDWVTRMIKKIENSIRYYIYDCNGNIVGNPKGYRTFKGANQQQNQKGSPAYRAIWDTYYQAKQADPSAPAFVSSIKQA